MFRQFFSTDSPYKKQARFVAIAWTLLILVGCFAPAKAFPEVDVPFADKWVHFIMFGGFTFFWLCSNPSLEPIHLFRIFLVSVLFGASIELLQGLLSFLGRSMEFMDAVADAVGGLIGVGIFYFLAILFKKKQIP